MGKETANRDRNRRYRERNREAVRARQRQWYLKNRKRILEERKARYDRDRDKVLAADKTPRGKEVRRAAVEKRRAGVHGGETIYRQVVFERDEGVCGICGGAVDPSNWHLDHIVPICQGGVHTYENVQVAHPGCNLRKGRG